MLACAQRGVNVIDLAGFFEREAGMIKLNVVEPSALVFSGGFDHSLPRMLSTRFFDVVAARLLLLVSWPAMLVVALCIRLESKGRSEERRVGKEWFSRCRFRGSTCT